MVVLDLGVGLVARFLPELRSNQLQFDPVRGEQFGEGGGR